MNKRAPLYVSAAAVFALAGCACLEGTTMGGSHHVRTQDCTAGGVCKIAVTADCAAHTVTVDAPVVVVHGNNVDIMWKIDGDQQFDAKTGIQFKTEACRAEFTNSSSNKNVFKWTDKNPRGEAHGCDYAITVLDSKGNACAHVDPTIVNGL